MWCVVRTYDSQNGVYPYYLFGLLSIYQQVTAGRPQGCVLVSIHASEIEAERAATDAAHETQQAVKRPH